MSKNPALLMTEVQERKVAQIIKLHGASITNVMVEMTTDEGQRVIVPYNAIMHWLKGSNYTVEYPVVFNSK